MTERLYYTDAYLCTFDGSIVATGDEGRRVYLDRTAFYPTSGGQPFDTGRLGAARVLDVVDEDERIAHLLDRPLAPGPVTGTIDWPRRFDHMQQHTGQHLLSAVLADLYGRATTGVHFGAASSTLDLDAADLTAAQVGAAEERANVLVTENRPVAVGFEDAAAAVGLRKASGRKGLLRIVTIARLDRSACGGTHVRATGEIGPILIRRVERVRRSARLEFLCGMRAVRAARADLELLARLAEPYSTPPEALPELLESRRTELRQALARAKELEAALDARRARELYEGAEPSAKGVRQVVVRDEPGVGMERLRGLAQQVTALPRVVFIGTIREPPAVLLAASADAELDAGRLLKPVLEAAGGRGGGNARMAQGAVSAGAIGEVVGSLLARVAGG